MGLARRLSKPVPRAGRRRARGFTLIELMMVILVAAVLVLVAAPSMSSLVAKQRLRSAASSLQLALVQARSEAIKRNVPVTLSPAAGGWSAGWSILNPENPAGPALEVTAIPPGVVVTTTAAQVVYRGNGRTTSDAAMSFALTGGADGASRCVKIEGSGRPYAKEGSCE